MYYYKKEHDSHWLAYLFLLDIQYWWKQQYNSKSFSSRLETKSTEVNKTGSWGE